MGSSRYESRQRSSITLDAGYVSFTSIDKRQSSKTLGLHGNKLICILIAIIILFCISFINLSYVIWLLYQLEWSIFDKNGSKVFRYDKVNQQIEFYRQVIFKEPIYTTKMENPSQIDLIIDEQIDIYGDQNSILFDDDQILFNTEHFYLKNNSSIDFTNLQLFKFDNQTKTRIHLNQFNSQHIHNKHLKLTANNHLTISNITNAFFYGQNLVLQANRHNRRSLLSFNNYPKPSNSPQKTSHGNLHLKSDSVYLDVPRFPLLGNNYRSEPGIYRICICNSTFLFLRSFAHQPCPLC